MVYNMIRIIANPRSGTLSTAKSLQQLGLDIQHEWVGKDGTVSCFFFIDNKWYPKGNTRNGKHESTHIGDGVPSDYKWKLTIHQVRNPLDCISSMYSLVGSDHKKWLVELGIINKKYLTPKLLLCMSMYYEQNKIFEGISDYRIRLEDNGRKLMKILKLKGEYPILHLHKTPPIFKMKEKLTWNKLFNTDFMLTEKIIKQANSYGYNINLKKNSIVDLLK